MKRILIYDEHGKCKICNADTDFGNAPHNRLCQLDSLIKEPTSNRLLNVVFKYEGDIDTCIAVYGEANAEIKNLNDVKTTCLTIAEKTMRKSGEVHYSNSLGGSAGLTKPKSKKLDTVKWAKIKIQIPEALELEERLANMEKTREKLEKQLKQYQENNECFVLNEPTFFIKR